MARSGKGADKDPGSRSESTAGLLLASADEALRKHWAGSFDGKARPDCVETLSDLRKALRSSPPSLLLLDLALPELAGSQGISGVVRFNPSTRIVALARESNDGEAVAVLLAGAHGYCAADTAGPMIRKMVEAVQRGELWAKRSVMLSLLHELIPPPPAADETEGSPRGTDARLQPLTRREREIAYLVSAGAKNKDIAASLNITETTVKAHLTAIFRKLGIPDRLRLALMITEGDRLEQDRSGRSR